VPAVTGAKAPALISDFGRGPLYFVPNRGQTDGRVDFYVQGNDKTVFFSPDGLTLVLKYPGGAREKGEPERWVVKLDFIGSREGVKPEGLEETGAVISYFSGKPEEWKTGLAAYSRIIYRDLWPGIDLVYKGELDELKYEFIVRPGANPARIRLAYRGAEDVSLTEGGRISVNTPAGGFEDDIPIAYQEADGRRSAISVAYLLESVPAIRSSGVVSDSGITSEDGSVNRTCAFGFEVGDYDRSQAFTIDPAVFIYCGFIGGSGDDESMDIAVDSLGNAYVAGFGSGTDFPLAVGPGLTGQGEAEAFVAKVNSSGTGLIYCGFICGSSCEWIDSIAVDDAGNAYVAGVTWSDQSTFPVKVGPDLTHNGGSTDAWVAKINPTGTDLVYCGYIGGSGDDRANAIAVDASGQAYVGGLTSSSQASFPVTVGPDLTYNGGNLDGFVAKVDALGGSLAYCGYIGGSGYEVVKGIDVDQDGNAYVAGETRSSQTSFPVTVGPDLTYNGGDLDGFVAKVGASGLVLEYCGYLGGAGWEGCSGIAVDGSGAAYVAGSTPSDETTFPVKIGPDLTHNGGGDDVYVAKVEVTGTGLIYCGYIGGANAESFAPQHGEGGIAVDPSGNAYVVGATASDESTFPVVDGPDLTFNGGGGSFVAKVGASGAELIYCGYVGKAGCLEDIDVDSSGSAYLTGSIEPDLDGFPGLVGPDLSHNGGWDAFIAKVSDVIGPPITSLLPDSADAGDPGFLLSVIGSDFADGAVVRWAESARTTTYVSSSELQAQIATADLAAGKTVQVTVRNPNGGISNALPFTIDNPLPSLASVSPTHVTGGGAAFTLTVQGSNFVLNSVVRWNGSARTTTYISSSELQAAILSTDLATGGEVQVTVYNPAPSGGASGAVSFQVSGFTLGATPASATVTAGQSATYTIQLTPQFGSFDSAVTFNCAGLPSHCTASFSPQTATPGAGTVTTTLTLTTKAASSPAGAAAGSLSGAGGLVPPTLGLFAFAASLLLGNAFYRRLSWRLPRRWLAACALVCLVIVIGSCSSGGNDDPPPSNGTPKGTYNISVQGTSGNITVPTVVTLVVN
jgi:hypothetical protein